MQAAAPAHRQHFVAVGMILFTILFLGLLSLAYAQTSGFPQQCIDAGITTEAECAAFLNVGSIGNATSGTNPCGNRVCEPNLGEGPSSCPVDCPSATATAYVCGNAVCEADKGETSAICPSDCPAPSTGGSTGTNAGSATSGTNPCGNRVCEPNLGEGPSSCPVDCPSATATAYVCGNAVCEADKGETSANCIADCPAPPPATDSISTNVNVPLNGTADASFIFPEQCKLKGITDAELCRRYLESLATQPAVPETCRAKGILDPEACRMYLESSTVRPSADSAIILPEECRAKGIADPDACKLYLESLANAKAAVQPRFTCGNVRCETDLGETPAVCPADCKPPAPTVAAPKCGDGACQAAAGENQTSCPADCPRAAIQLPEPCARAGVGSESECAEFIRKQQEAANAVTLPKECQEKGISDPRGCEEYFRSLRGPDLMLPSACVEAGLKDEKTCRMFLESKRASAAPSKLAVPKACADRGVFSVDECAKLLNGPIGETSAFAPEGGFRSNVPTGFLPKECLDKRLVGLDCRAYLESQMTHQPVDGIELPKTCVDEKISNAEACKSFMMKRSLPKECLDAGIETSEACARHFQERSVSADCRAKGATSGQACEELIVKSKLPAECLAAGIADPAQCGDFIGKKFLPKSCVDVGATTAAACEKVVFDKYGRPAECAGLTDAECRKLIDEKKIGQDIVAKLDAEEMSDECRRLGAKSFDDCQELLREKVLPGDCRDQGIMTRDACDQHIFTRMAKDGEEAVAAALPDDCRAAGVTEAEACRRLMEARFFPKECKDAGITASEACAKFMEIKHLPATCRERGLTTAAECEASLRREILAPACANHGITDAAACEEFVAGKMSPQVACDGLSKEECVVVMKKRHLGALLEAQTRIDEIAARIEEFRDQHVLLGADEDRPLGEKEGRFQDVLPVKPTEKQGFVVLESRQQLAITAGETVLAAAPAVVVYDNDGDGVPDDIEKRYGLDPNKADSTGDGKSDAEHLKAVLARRARPGELTAPIDRAIAAGREIGQPLAEGDVDEALKVETAASEPEPETPEPDKKPAPIKLKGKGIPGSVVTLYVYSELPLVVTTAVGENGDWSYDISDPMKDGAHTVYVAINDDTGKVVRKSNPLSFFVSEARAASPSEFVGEAQAAEAQAAAQVRGEVNVEQQAAEARYMRYFFIGSLALLVIAGVLLIFIFKKKPLPPS